MKWIDEIRVYSGGFPGERGALAASLNTPEQKATTESAKAPLSFAVTLTAALGAAALHARRGA